MHAYRHQILRQLTYGSLPAFMALQQRRNELLAEHGLTPYTVWAPAFGGLHHMVLEATFPSMAAFEQEFQAVKKVPELAALNAETLQYVVAGSAEDRLQRLAAQPAAAR